MADHDPTVLREKLKTWMPDALLDHLARHCGFVQRDTKLDVVVFIWTLILGWSAGAKRTLTGLARTHQRCTGSGLIRSGFYRRFDDS